MSERVFVGPHRFIHGDCLEVMPELLENSVDLVLTDPPYGTTACKWDTVIPFEPMWAGIRHCLKSNGAAVLTASQPFTSGLIASNFEHFKYEWIYEKTNPKGFLSARSRPLTAHENVCVFSFGNPLYFPQKWTIPDHLRTKRKHATSHTSGEVYGAREIIRWDDDGSRYPTTVIGFSNRVGRDGNYHPTQKPVALMEYLIRTYSQEGDTVLDFTMGSGTTGIACQNTGRKFIGIEKDDAYFQIAVNRNQKWMDEAATRDSQGDLF